MVVAVVVAVAIMVVVCSKVIHAVADDFITLCIIVISRLAELTRETTITAEMRLVANIFG